MSSDFTRRNFLKVSGLGSLAAITRVPEHSYTAPTPHPAPSGPISSWVTTDDKKLAASTLPAWQPSSAPAPNDAIILNPEKKFQPILGFGAAFTDAACYMFNELSADSRAQLFHTLFHPSEMGLNVCRTCIGSSDYATKVYSFDEGEPDPDLTRFSIDHDKQYILPMLREARQVNPDLFLFSSPWSPPGWMKPNQSMLGGSMRRKYMPSYANYFLKFLQGYEAEGVPVQAITVQNEVDTEQDGRMPACAWPQEYEADFVRQNLGPTLESTGSKTKIWIIDHNYNLWGRACSELETPGVRKYTNAIAWHGYVGEPEWVGRVHEKYPDVEMYWTEGGPDYTDPNYAKEWCSWSQTFAGILRNWCRSITGWNLALDEKGRPNIGPFNCGGMVTINSQTKAITYSGQFWAFAHYSRFIRRGAVRIESQGGASGVSHAAFQNPDQQNVLVLTNPGAARTCELRMGDTAMNVPLPANSVTTLRWE
jgi:glucosylceramidase